MFNELYNSKQTHDMTSKIDAVLDTLPEYMGNFPNWCMEKYSLSSTMHYLQDIRVFFYFISTISEHSGIQSITPEDIKAIGMNKDQMSKYHEWLDCYTVNGKTYRNSISGKTRKMSAVRRLFDYLSFPRPTLVKTTPPKPEPDNAKNVFITSFLRDSVNNATILKNKPFTPIIYNMVEYKKELSDIRNAAIYLILAKTNLSLSQVIGLDITDINFFGNDTIFLYGTSYQFKSEEIDIIYHYLYHVRDQIESNTFFANALFLSWKHSRISQRMIETAIKKESHGILTPHDLLTFSPIIH